MKNIKKFSTTTEFNNASLQLPNTALTLDDRKVHYTSNVRTITRSITAHGYITGFYDVPLKLVSPNMTIYTIRHINRNSNNSISPVWEELTIIPANIPFVIENNGSATSVVLQVAEWDEVKDVIVEVSPYFIGSTEARHFTVEETTVQTEVLLLQGSNFVTTEGEGDVPANRCWI